ncbi:MAG: hypothetical protein B7Z33_03270 [Sphingomonadales bacterium 12-68-11]|nr:MAG: hypothetical protein B7Z33_03270 [Sphingomonadales bacterium 12-68-11]
MPGHRAPPDLEAQGRAIVERLGGRWNGANGLCRCPAHDDRRPSLSVRLGRRNLLLHCFAGCDTPRIIRALRELGQVFHRRDSDEIVRPRGRSGSTPAAAALRLWHQARPSVGTPAERYLARRGLEASSDELRYHPCAPHGPRPFTRFRPALVAAVRDESGLVAVHRSFLELDGLSLAVLDEPRMGLGPFGAGAVRLGGVAPCLGLAEGLETALSASILFGQPCWATLGTERFARLALPPEVQRLVLFLDNDAGGRRAEQLARATFAELPIEVHYPPASGEDWNDVLREQPAPSRP